MLAETNLIENDLYIICKEYEKYFKQITVVQVDAVNKSHALIIETNEGDHFKVGICINGWFLKDTIKPTYYETFEGLMNVIYPQFRATFANDLFSKLNALQR